LAIGMFDGVHRGHQALIASLLAEAGKIGGDPVVVTFDPHPVKVLRPGSRPHLLSSFRHKLWLLGRYGVPAVLCIPFTVEFAQMPPGDFIGRMASACGTLALVAVGHRWEFGHRRSGNVALLENLGEQMGFAVMELPPVTEDGDLVSSTRIRQAVRDGNLAQAELLLGRRFSLFGKVERGDGLGRQLGFPTANIQVEGEMLPPFGVYAAAAIVGDRRWPSALNIGVRPTVSGEGLRVEAHLIGFSGDLYGHDLEVELISAIRPERKFPSQEALARQIGDDIAQATALCQQTGL